MYIEPNACDSFIIWDNILELRQRKALLNQTNISRGEKHKLWTLNTYEMNDKGKQTILEGFSSYRKTDYFQNKVYPRYIRTVSTAVNTLTLFDVSKILIPNWINNELERFKKNLENISTSLKLDFMSKEPLRFNPDCYEGRTAFHITMNKAIADPSTSYNDHQLSYTKAWSKIDTSYNVDDNTFTIQDGDREGKLKNRLFYYDDISYEIAPLNIKCSFDHFPTWMQYMILSEPMPFVNATNDCITVYHEYTESRRADKQNDPAGRLTFVK